MYLYGGKNGTFTNTNNLFVLILKNIYGKVDNKAMLMIKLCCLIK